MMPNKRCTVFTAILSVWLVLSIALSACQPGQWGTGEGTPIATQPNSPQAAVTQTGLQETSPAGDGKAVLRLQVTLPDPLSPGEIIYLVVVDALTGYPYNQSRYPMTAESDRTLSYELVVPAGSTVHYRYLRQAGQALLPEALKNGLLEDRTAWAGIDTNIHDTVFCWLGDRCNGAVGRIAGIVLDETGKAIQNVRVSAGGVHSFSSGDGSYFLEDVPAGHQNLTAFPMDGRAFVFQQGAQVNPESLTPANIPMQALPLVEVVFITSLPVDTPQDAVVRLVGNLAQFGNSFTDLSGGIRSTAAQMPVLSRLENGNYYYRTMLPAGAEIRYRYTLGDGLWNSEHSASGAFAERRLIIPDHNMIQEDTVASWHYGTVPSLDLFVIVPTVTPANEIVSVQFDPGLGWMEPLAMWPAGENLWHLTLFSPLVGVQKIQYRYCRNMQCDSSPEILNTPRIMIPGEKPQVIEDTVEGWQWWQGLGDPPVVPSIEVVPRNEGFLAGIGWTSHDFRVNWVSSFANAAAETASLNAEWLLLRPSWSANIDGLPRLNYAPDKDFDGITLQKAFEEAGVRGLNVILYPTVNFPGDPEQWWLSAERSFTWWLSWFDNYHRYLVNFASIAEQEGAGALVLGESWLDPATTWGLLADGRYSGSPVDADERWQNLIQDIRARYHGRIYWAQSYDGQAIETPEFADQLDGFLVLWAEGLSPDPSYDANGMAVVAGALLDTHLRDLRIEMNKPVILGISYPSARGISTGCIKFNDGCASTDQLSPSTGQGDGIVLDLQEQQALYNAVFTAIAARDWLDGVIVMDFFPAGPVQDLSASVYAKPASGVVWYWFGKFLGK